MPSKELAKSSFWHAILVALITGVASFAVAWVSHPDKEKADPHKVPRVEPQIVQQLPPESDKGFALSRDISVFDLRDWKEVPDDALESRYSPTNYINYLQLSKTSPVSTYVARYGTNGYAIDLRCITQRATVSVLEHSPRYKHEYSLQIDVSK